MFLTETDFINAKLMAEGAMNESDIIKINNITYQYTKGENKS